MQFYINIEQITPANNKPTELFIMAALQLIQHSTFGSTFNIQIHWNYIGIMNIWNKAHDNYATFEHYDTPERTREYDSPGFLGNPIPVTSDSRRQIGKS